MQLLHALEALAESALDARYQGKKIPGWVNHPATKMWIGYSNALALYMNEAIRLWISRGFKNTMQLADVDPRAEMPWWFGNEEFHASHRAALLAKDPLHYSRFGWDELPNINYVWPSATPPSVPA